MRDSAVGGEGCCCADKGRSHVIMEDSVLFSSLPGAMAVSTHTVSLTSDRQSEICNTPDTHMKPTQICQLGSTEEQTHLGGRG